MIYIGVSHPLGKHAQGSKSRISNVFGYISSKPTSAFKVSLKQMLQFPQAQNMFRKQISRLCFLETHLFLCHGFTSCYAAPPSFSCPVLLVLKCRWRLALDIKSLRCFSLAYKKLMHSRNENYKALRIPVSSGADGRTSLALFKKKKQNKWRPFPINPKEFLLRVSA